MKLSEIRVLWHEFHALMTGHRQCPKVCYRFFRLWLRGYLDGYRIAKEEDEVELQAMQDWADYGEDL